MPDILNPKLTASWEKGLTGVAEGNITNEEYKQVESLVDEIGKMLSSLRAKRVPNASNL